MAPSRSSSTSLSTLTGNKQRRQGLFIVEKKRRSKEKRDERMQRRKAERDAPELRRMRLAKSKPQTLETKRVWDEGNDDSLGVQVNMAELRRRQREAEEEAEIAALEAAAAEDQNKDEEDIEEDAGYDSMLEGSDEDEDEEGGGKGRRDKGGKQRQKRDTSQAPSIAPSTASTTNLNLAPSSLIAKFPLLFADSESDPRPPKILVTTSLNSTLHEEAQLLCDMLPNSTYVRRSAHRYGHKYSLREISRFAANRDHTAVVLMHEDQKVPSGLSIVHLPTGPTLTFSITPGSWMPGKKIPGHGNATDHYPEVVLQNFNTPLGILTGKVLQTLFPPSPEFGGRQVVSFTNLRDYIFVRRHRYVFRESDRSIDDEDGKPMKGVEGVRVGLQELGPRWGMKLRRVDKGIGWAGSHGEDALQWKWKAGMEKDRKRFNL